MPPRVISAEQAADAIARREDWDRVQRGPEKWKRKKTQLEYDVEAESSVPPEVAKEHRRKREWRKRMRESKEALERAPVVAEGYRQMERMGGKIGRGDRGQVVVAFPEGGMRRP